MNLDGTVTAPTASGTAAVPPAAGQDGQGGQPVSSPAEYVYDLDRPPSLPRPELTQLLGGKAANLVVMATELGLPVPPGFTITTAACNAYLASGWPAGLDERAPGRTSRRVGERVGRRFGDPARPAAGQRPFRRPGLDARA